ncbi:MAG: type IV pilus twitching motility protein PilT [Deltaproteobacteria bacterium]|nr:type IV pilus twitching motility protein PilT [Deltaproteobacteria bacterium]
MARIDSFLRLVADQSASDLHFASGAPPSIRHDGDLIPLPFRALSALEARKFLYEILAPDEQKSLERGHELDFVYALGGVARFRVNVFLHTRGPGAIFRVIPKTPPSIDELLLPGLLKRITEYQNGLVLVCGPTGSGKTTTLAAMIDEINSHPSRSRHIVTIEDPIEFIHEPRRSLISQRQVGQHTESFTSALRSALRESPDVIVVGELRDVESISLALAAAETGVLVFGTLHTNSAAKAVDRLIDAFPDEARDQARGSLSVLLKAVVAQELVKRASGDGRIAAVEVLLSNTAIANLIRENKIHQIEAMMFGADGDGTGMLSLDACLFRYVRDGLVTLEEALTIANDPARLQRKAQEIKED